MKRFTVINMKGGCGKTTIATNLASAYACRGRTTTLIDYDPQGSSMYWMNARPKDVSKINGIAAYPSNRSVTRSWQLQLPMDTDRVIVDTPAGLSGLNLIDQIRGTHTIIIPVLSSYLDTHVTADFIRDLYLTAKVRPENTRLCIVCNRVKTNTLSFKALKRFLDSLDIPIIGQLRETQRYVRASDQGLGIHELKLQNSDRDIDDWNKIITWLDSEVRHKDIETSLRLA